MLPQDISVRRGTPVVFTPEVAPPERIQLYLSLFTRLITGPICPWYLLPRAGP
jgi:hypothetical protein